MYTVKKQCIFLPDWLLVSAITAITRPILYKNFKKVGYVLCVRCYDVWDPIYHALYQN